MIPRKSSKKVLQISIRLAHIIHESTINYGVHSIFAALNSVEKYRNGIFLGVPTSVTPGRE
jgi:hypothetical protein